MPKVLIADKMSPRAEALFKEHKIDVDVAVGLEPSELIERIGAYDGLAIRSATKVTADVLAAAENLKVVGRAGIGVDNVDLEAATGGGVVGWSVPVQVSGVHVGPELLDEETERGHPAPRHVAV